MNTAAPQFIKSLVLVLMAVFPLLLFSCKEDNDPVPANKMSVLRNGVSWEPTVTFSLDTDTDTLYILSSGIDGYLRMQVKLAGKGTYKTPSFWAKYLVLVGGDVITDAYFLEEGSNTEFIITEYDAERNLIRGTFRVSLKDRTPNSLSAEVLNFTNGEFSGVINEYRGIKPL